MNISYNLLQNFLPLSEEPEALAETLTNLGLAVDAYAPYESIKGGLAGVVVGKVVECIRHPNADRLSLTRVDLGTGALHQIVCGASNVAAGQTVLVATPGTKLYNTKGEPLEIRKGKIRGETSDGMICAADELGLSDDHSGIMVIPDHHPAGAPATDVISVYRDTVFEIDLTPNRSDATSHLGVAKDLAAYFAVQTGKDPGFKAWGDGPLPELHLEKPVRVIVEDPVRCPRYSGISLSGVTIRESPDWLKERLNAIGVRPISNVVDVTNWILHLYGQPLHAFDLDKIGGGMVRIKTLPRGTKFVSLDAVERSLHEDDLMICDADSQPLCIAGVFGGIGSGISADTKNIFLESAHFSASSVRRTSMRHVLRTDAATRFEKGTDPNITIKALREAARLIVELAGGYLSSDFVDVYERPIEPVQVELSLNKVRSVIGQEIPDARIKKILDALDMPVLGEHGDRLRIAVPTNKSDVKRDIDVIEEILRIHGFNAVPMPAKMEVSFAISSDASRKEKLREGTAAFLSSLGFHEIMGMSLMESRILSGSGLDAKDLVLVNNTSNINLDVMRPDMLRSGLQSIQYNQSRQQGMLKFYEFGFTYHRSPDAKWPFRETPSLAVFIYGPVDQEHWDLKDARQGFFFLKGLIHQLLAKWQLGTSRENDLDHPDFEFAREISIEGTPVAVYGKVQESLGKVFDLRADLYYAFFHWDKIWEGFNRPRPEKVQIPGKYPSVRRDLAFVVDKAMAWQQIRGVLEDLKIPDLVHFDLFDMFENVDRIGPGKKSLAISLIFENPNQTLRDADLERSMNLILQALKQKTGASVR